LNTQNQIQIDNCTKHNFPTKIFSDILEIVVLEETLPKDTFVSLKLTEDETIKILNNKYFGRNYFTDVISFSASIPNIPLLGDIIIDTKIANLQKENRTLEEEIQTLFLHGILHLLGYDHLSKKQGEIMRTKEHKYLKILKEDKLREY